MVKTQNLVPEIYYKESRDFQYFGRLFDIIFNYAKTNVDLLAKINYKTQSNLIDLVLQTLGFQPDYNSKIDSLSQLSLIWSSLIKKKGTKSAVEQLLKSLLNYEGSDSELSLDYYAADGVHHLCNTLEIVLSSDIANDEIYLIERVLDYILPVTVVFQITKASVQSQATGYLVQDEYAEVQQINPTFTIANDSSITTDKVIAKSANEKFDTIKAEDSGDIRFTRVASDNDTL